MKSFSAKIFIIGVNPYVLLPAGILKELFAEAGKEKGHIPVRIVVNEKSFIQTIVKYSGKWRLYLNGPMRRAAGKDVGDTIAISICYDGSDRTVPIHSKFEKALAKNKEAKAVFEKLSPSLQKEISRYLHHLKTEESIERNVQRAVNFLLGKERFIGRDKPI